MGGTQAVPGQSEVPLEAVIVQDAFHDRPSRPADLLRENLGLQELAKQLTEDPEGILQRLVQVALFLTDADSAGVSLLETLDSGERVFRWAALAGSATAHPGTTTPALWSPCGTCLDRRAPTLFSYPEKHFTWMRRFGISIVEGLVVPLRLRGKDIGTIWVMLHSQRRKFDMEDRRILESSADFAIAAYQLNATSSEAASDREREREARAIAEEGQTELRIIEQRLRLALDSAKMVAWEWRPETGKIFRSGNVEEVLGVPAAAAAGRRFVELIHPDDRHRVMAAVDEGLNGKPYNCEYRLLPPNGTVRWVADLGGLDQPSRGEAQHFSGVLADITERKRAEHELDIAQQAMRRSHELFQRVLDSVPNGSINVFDRDLRYVLAAGKGLGQVGLSSQALVGKTVDELFSEESARFVRGWYDRAFRGETVQFELAVGNEFYLIAAGPLTEQRGEIKSIVVVAENITERKRAEEVLLKQADELARSNADLQQFAYVTSHDLQEPVRTIISFSQLLALRPASLADPEQHELLRHITEAGTRMKELISSLLEYSNVASTEAPAPVTVDMNAALRWATLNLNAIIEESGAVITHDLLPSVSGIQLQLVRLLQNLIGNAIKYRSAAPPRIHVGVEKKPDGWLFSVRDNGLGIEREYLEGIFGVFKRLHGREIPGTGIGLAICRRIVENHGGRIWAESGGPGQGATFFFQLLR